MKKFEEELFSEVPCKFGLSTEGEYKQSILVKHFGDWISPEDHQQVAKALVNTTDKLNCAEERVGLLEKTVDQLKSQLEKQQPEIPQFVAEFIKKYKGNWSLVGAFKNILENRVNNETLYNWVFAHAGKQELFAQAWLNGYTVAKEKRFYLKNKLTGGYIEQDCYNGTRETYNRHDRTVFTQQEIDSMAAESYEQIEVEK